MTASAGAGSRGDTPGTSPFDPALPPAGSGEAPVLVTAPALGPVLDELVALEPLFHWAGTTTDEAQAEALVAPEFWEVGASGRLYSRELVLRVQEQRRAEPGDETWELTAPYAQELAPELYLLAYTLELGGRTTRRTSIWRRTAGGWQVVHHQGTVVAG